MSAEHYDLHHEFPDLHHRIHELKMSDAHFRRLFDEYHELTTNIETMEDEVIDASGNETRLSLHDIQVALDRLADGIYGQCEACGNDIGEGRLLKAIPEATRCVSCAGA